MKFDKLSMFADGLAVPTTASTSTYSKVLDLRKCGEVGIDGMLRVWGGVKGTANSTGSVTTKLVTSADGKTWTTVASAVQSGAQLIAMFLPCAGLKRFVRLEFVVGTTALGSAISVVAGLVDQFDQEDLPTVQTFPPLEDLTILGDAMETKLTLSASSGTITKGSSGTVTINSGIATALIGPTAQYTLTQSGSTITIALSSTAASGTVYVVDGLGNKVAYEVTAA